jgi:TPP-dependent pyruvate/acetoin dehydrogenase alpha subunit
VTKTRIHSQVDSNSSAVRLLRTMLLIRRTEEMLMSEYAANEMRCPMHFCVGQEAMPAVLALLIARDDVLMSHYRSHGYYLAKGAPLNAMVAEFYGKETGANGGVAGSMELAAHDFNYYSGAIVGGAIIVPLGSAFAQKYYNLRQISVAVFGDGALDEGVTYEAFNLAALHRLPLLMICENNKYAAHTPVDRRMTTRSLSERARVFGIPTLQVSDGDPVRLLQQIEHVMAEVRAGNGPHFVELETYRYSAHVGPTNDDALGYRPADEINLWKARDPLTRLQRELVAAEGQPAFEAMLEETDSVIASAILFAKSSRFPNYAKTLAMNWSGEYSPVVKRFVSDPARWFDSAQPEGKPAPF